MPERFVLTARRGGERITLPQRAHSHALRQCLQQAGVPPWQRERLPLLWSDDGELLAAGDRIISARLQRWCSTHDLQLDWRRAAGVGSGN
jgi:tRNA(Ile)-lysidine synthase